LFELFVADESPDISEEMLTKFYNAVEVCISILTRNLEDKLFDLFLRRLDECTCLDEFIS
jgi:hypothetical protein